MGGVNHLTGGSKKEGRVTCDTLLKLCNGEPVDLTVDGGAELTVQAGRAPIINGVEEAAHAGRLRLGDHRHVCQAMGGHHVDEVVVVDDHITGVLSEHQAGQGARRAAPTGIRDQGPPLDAGALLPGGRTRHRLGRHRHLTDPLTILDDFDPKKSRSPARAC